MSFFPSVRLPQKLPLPQLQRFLSFFRVLVIPSRYGLVASLSRPGGNATGASLLTKDLAEKRLQLHLPAMYDRAEYVDFGGLMSYGVNFPDMYDLAVDYVAKIFSKGAKPSGLPVWQPTKVELVINRRTAKALDLTIPLSLLAFAERTIE